MQQLTIAEAINQRLNPKPATAPKGSTQTESEARCRKGTAPHVLAFFATLRPGQEYRLDDLTNYVRARHRCAPDTPRKIASVLRASGEVFWKNDERDESLYTFLGWPEAEAEFVIFERNAAGIVTYYAEAEAERMTA